MTILINLLLAIYVVVALLMLLVILMQRPKSEGLGAAFGGGVTENIFGAQTTNVLTKFTAWLAGVFFILTFALSILYAHRSIASSGLRRELMKNQATAPAPAGSPGPAKTTGASPVPERQLNNAPQGTVSPIQTPAPPAPADAAVGIVPPASAPLAPSATPAASKQPRR
ncbi:MAG: preprotein translocase subunit SecG [Verrucomicrobiota bacterium]|jgi:preprotein translocase subunit SecG|nr:preprotein translocase subunit SecG [Verrucomicrobiota bacterium]